METIQAVVMRTPARSDQGYIGFGAYDATPGRCVMFGIPWSRAGALSDGYGLLHDCSRSSGSPIRELHNPSVRALKEAASEVLRASHRGRRVRQNV